MSNNSSRAHDSKDALLAAFDRAQALDTPPHEALKLYRQIIGESSTKVAKALGVTRTSYSRWEHGHADIRPSALFLMHKIAHEKVANPTLTPPTWTELTQFASE